MRRILLALMALALGLLFTGCAPATDDNVKKAESKGDAKINKAMDEN